jgi:hypothetical protein
MRFRELPLNVQSAVTFLRDYTSTCQYEALREALRGEESEHFQTVALTLRGLVHAAPPMYFQDGMKEQATVYLHYFGHRYDAYILEIDTENPLQAYGLMRWDNGELKYKYIDLLNLIENNAELDFYFKVRNVGQLREECTRIPASTFTPHNAASVRG